MSNLNKEIKELRSDILRMGVLVQELIQKAIKAMVDKDIELAKKVKQGEDLVDEMEMEIEQKCLTLVALKQPMARDLREIGGAFRIIVDLERMSDHAEDLADITISLKDEPYIKPLIDIPRIAELCQQMLKQTLDSYINGDVGLVYDLVYLEPQVDALYDQIFRELVVYMMEDARKIKQAASLLIAAGHLERIADHITNIGEMVIYAVEGKRLDLNQMSRTISKEELALHNLNNPDNKQEKL